MAAPDTIPNLSAWWKADSLALAAGAAVSSWADSGPGGFTATQATAAARPTFQTGQINGKPVVRFDGVDDGLVSGASSSHPETTIFAVVRPSTVTATGIYSVRAGSGSGALIFRIRDTKINFGYQAVTQAAFGTTSLAANASRVITGSYSDSANTTAYYLDGSADGGSTAETTSLTAGLTSAIGMEPGQSARYFVGDIAEIIIYSRVLTASERAEVHSYLQDRYAIAVSDYVGQTIAPTSIASAEAWGTPQLTVGLAVSPAGIPSAEAWGSPAVAAGPVTVAPTSIASAEAWGAPQLQHVITMTGIASAEAFGSAAFSLTVAPAGIPSGEAWGSTVFQYLQEVFPTSIPSGELWGTPTITVTVALATTTGTRRRRAVPVYELLMMGRLPRQAGPPTFLLADPIEWSTLSWTTTLSKPQSLSVSCSIANLTDPVKQRLQAPHLLPTELWLQRDGKTVFAGPLLGGTEDSDQLNLEAGGLLTYLQWMFVETDLRFTQVDQVTIARTLVDNWQATEYGHFGINTADVAASGVLRDVVYERDEIHQVSRRIEEMGAAALGFDAEVDPGSRNLQLWSPTQGIDRSTGPDAVVFDGRSIEGLGGMFSITPADLASDAIGTGTAPGGDETFWSQQSDPDLRAVFGRTGIASSFPDAANQGALDDFVKGLRDARGEPLRAPGRQVRVTPDTDLNSYDVGDTVSYQLSGVLGIGGAYRIRSRRVSVRESGQETVSLEFV